MRLERKLGRLGKVPFKLGLATFDDPFVFAVET